DQHINPIESSCHRGDKLRHVITKHLHCKHRILVIFVHQQLAHVAELTRDSAKTGFMIDQLIELLDRVTLGLEQVQYDTRIQISRAGSHHPPAGWRKSHGGIDRFSILNCAQAAAISQMSNYQLCWKLGAQSLHDELVGKPVEAIPPETLLPEFIGKGQTGGVPR